MADTILRVENLKKDFGTLPVIDGWNLELAKEERIAMIGPSGCGKTTFLKIIADLDRNFSGNIERNFERVGFVFQEPRLIPWISVMENLTFVSSDEDKIIFFLKAMRLEGFENYLPSQLSGGMKQRVNLVRALIVDPEILILDEPFASLDMPVKFAIIADINALRNQKRFAIIMITHDTKEAISMADRVLILSKRPSKIVEDVKIDLQEGERDISNTEFIKIESILMKRIFSI
ncbi:MAG: ATP-binding cassette domain-containing protein [Thermotogae bacterium]|jgi:NitT/TauT family transport system ATP-binding protein|nr:ATP-binding cassette domain-containing protein [Thermotogota bacterium]MCL5032341.1 ATP-binding cassette domain-containing protein [Thermotogota bacterium]